MKIIKPALFYIGYNLFLFIGLGFYSMGSLSELLRIYNDHFIIFNIFFASLYFYINEPENYFSLLVLIILSLTITSVSLETIFPDSLKANIILFDEDTYNITADDSIPIEKNEVKLELEEIGRAQYYFENSEFSSAFIYADRVLDKDPGNVKALEIKEKSKNELYRRGNTIENPKYIETVKYKNLVSQKRYLDAYYFCLEQINGSEYDYDFSIKLNNCHEHLMNEYYAIHHVESMLKLAGYSDIQFYYTKNGIEHYSILKLVEYNDEVFIKDLKIGDLTYPYIYINSDGKIFSSGFNEEKREVLSYDSPQIPVTAEDLKLFSREYYTLLNSSLSYSINIFRLKNIKYIEDKFLSEVILDRVTGYLTLIVIFFMVLTFNNNRNYINEFFIYTIFVQTGRWYIKKIGSIIIYYGLSLSVIFVFISFSLWIFYIIKKSNQQLSLF